MLLIKAQDTPKKEEKNLTITRQAMRGSTLNPIINDTLKSQFVQFSNDSNTIFLLKLHK